MAYRYGNRYQINMFPERIEDYVAENDPARIYDEFVNQLDYTAIGLKLNSNKVGNPEYDPKAMLKILLYGYSYGIRSSRKLERAVHHNITFIWLAGGLKPDHKTIANFRKRNHGALKKIFKECAKLCIKLEVIEGNTLFLDGSKMRANAGISQTVTLETAMKKLEKIEKRINQILKECDKVDKSEQHLGSLVKLREELSTAEKRKKKIEAAMKEIESEERSINLTDPDCVKVKGRQGINAGYNSQVVTDEKHGLIVNADVVAESTDLNQLENQIDQANETLGENCENAVADAGYANTEEFKKLDDKGINIVVPNKEQALHNPKEDNLFSKSKFHYDKEKNEYICPMGFRLRYDHFNKEKQHYRYTIKSPKTCIACIHYGVCTKNKKGRFISRLKNEEIKQKVQLAYEKKESKILYDLRKQKVELQFGHLKRNLGIQSFLLRGINGVRAEMGIMATCFNLRRLQTILGFTNLMTALSS